MGDELFLMFRRMAGVSLSSYETMRPRYLNWRTDLSTLPYAENVRSRSARPSAATACWRRAAVILAHVAEASWAGVPAVETCIPHSWHLRKHSPASTTLWTRCPH